MRIPNVQGFEPEEHDSEEHEEDVEATLKTVP
jgi:hypothetical protein